MLPPEGVEPVYKPEAYADLQTAAALRMRRKHGVMMLGLPHLPEQDGCLPLTLLAVPEDRRRFLATEPREEKKVKGTWLLSELAAQMLKEKPVPAAFIAADERTGALLTDFCRQCGIALTVSTAAMPIITEAAEETAQRLAALKEEEK